jgi:TolB-like protein/tetratricopeptide (TPR) repeat protein
MTKKHSASALGSGWEQAVRQQLDRILAGATFQQVDRLRRFLSFVVLESIAGRQDELKEYVVGIQVFGKEASFDPRSDPVVRVQARRLRARLVRYYAEEGQGDEILVELPKGGYAPVFSRREAGTARRHSLSTAIVNRNTACVLAFADHSPSGDLAYFCRGLREEIVHRLAALKNLRVLAWDGSDTDDRTAGRPGGGEAAVIISGSVRTAGDRVRVTTQFLDGASGCYLWSASIDGLIAEMFETQERVAATVADRLGSELVELSSPSRHRPGTANLAAYNLYLQGRYHLSQRNEEGLRKAVEFFERSLVEDAQYGLAHSGLSDAYSLLAHYGVLGGTEVWTKVAATAASAVMLDPNSAEAHTSLAHAKATQDWDWQGAEQAFRRAISLDPRYATAPHWYSATVLVPTGRIDEAISRMHVAQSLDPVSVIIARDLSLMYYYKRDFDSALERCDNAIELNPHFSPAYLTLAFIQEQRNEMDESEAALERAVSLAPRSPRSVAALGRLHAITGRRRQAFKALHELQALFNERYVTPFEFASLHFFLGQIDECHEWLVKAVADRSFDLLSIKADPRYDVLRTHPKMAPVVDRVGVMAPPSDTLFRARGR